MMFAIHARYRGRERRRADFVRQSARALSTLPDVSEFDVVGVEDIRAIIYTPEAMCDTTMALLAAGDWAVGLAVLVDDGLTDKAIATEQVLNLASTTLGAHARSGQVKVGVKRGNRKDPAWSADIQAAFTMLAHILSKRTAEGREATSLVRSGMNQNEAAAELGISKQAMSQRLQAAGWQAEMAGYRLAISLLNRVGTS